MALTRYAGCDLGGDLHDEAAEAQLEQTAVQAQSIADCAHAAEAPNVVGAGAQKKICY